MGDDTVIPPVAAEATTKKKRKPVVKKRAPKPKPKASGERGAIAAAFYAEKSKSRFPSDATIRWIGAGPDRANPYSKKWSRWAPVEYVRRSHGRTIGKFLALGGSARALSLACRQGYVKIK